MVDVGKLKSTIRESGITMVALSRKTGILRETLYNRLNGTGEFTASEIAALSLVLGLTTNERDEIFFARKVELNETTKQTEDQQPK